MLEGKTESYMDVAVNTTSSFSISQCASIGQRLPMCYHYSVMYNALLKYLGLYRIHLADEFQAETQVILYQLKSHVEKVILYICPWGRNGIQHRGTFLPADCFTIPLYLII